MVNKDNIWNFSTNFQDFNEDFKEAVRDFKELQTTRYHAISVDHTGTAEV